MAEKGVDEIGEDYYTIRRRGYAPNVPEGYFKGEMPKDLRSYIMSQLELSKLGQRFFNKSIDEDTSIEDSMSKLDLLRKMNIKQDSMVRGLLFDPTVEELSQGLRQNEGLSQEERQAKAMENLRVHSNNADRRATFERYLEKEGYDEGGYVQKPLMDMNAGAPITNEIVKMYNRGPQYQGGLSSLTNPSLTPVGGEEDRQKMLDMQRDTFRKLLTDSVSAGDVSSGGVGGGGDGDQNANVDPTEDIPFVNAVVNPDAEGGYEAPVYDESDVAYGAGDYTQQQQNMYGPYYDGFSGRDNGVSVNPIDFKGLGVGALGLAGKALSNHPYVKGGRYLLDKTGIGETMSDDELDTLLTDYGPGGQFYEPGGLSDEEMNLASNDFGIPRQTDQMVQDAIDIDTDQLLADIDNTQLIGGTSAERNAALERARSNNITRGLNERQETEDAFSNRYGAMFEPGSGYGNATPMLSSDRGQQFASGRVGIQGRSLPKAGSGFGGNNPFQSEAPAPGTPGYADYIIDSMGFDPQNVHNEVSEMVRKEMPFHTAYDQEGNTILIDKMTGEQQVIPATPGNQSIQQGQKFVGGIGGGMNLGGLVSSLPLKHGYK